MEQQVMEPLNFDAAIPPDAPAGGWTGVASVKRVINSNGRPMLIINWTLESADEGDNESYVGTRVTEFLTICAKGDKGERPNKQTLHALAGLLDFDVALVPQQITGLDDLIPLAEAIEGQKAQFKTYVDKNNKTRINYGRTVARAASSDEGESTNGQKKNGNGKGKRR